MKDSEIPNMTITDETTIGDLEQNDRANYTEAVQRNHKIYTFPSVPAAHEFMGQAFDKIMRRCGVHIKPGDRKAHIDKLLKREGVKVEQRTYGKDEKLYKSGLFVYTRGEIAGYVSSPFVQVGGSPLYQPPKFYIQTTEKDM
ncbi:MAG: hypothetical protein GY737_13885 [Desulfobacteraceae bacterium]|nr:hypothetical protein [Desulfobacteraceae bacterium]